MTDSPLVSWLRGLLPRQAPMSSLERLVAVVGGLAGIALTAILTTLIADDATLPLIIAPMGASAVLVFAVPASPLAQPWSVVGGNTLSAFAGVTSSLVLGESTPVLAAAVGVAAAIGLMSLARCVHPPGGAVALTAVVGGPAIHALGFDFAFMPVLLSSCLLVSVGLAFNNAMRRRYPHVAPPAPAPVRARIDITRADIDRALADLDEQLDVDPDDVEALVRTIIAQAEARVAPSADEVRHLRPGTSV